MGCGVFDLICSDLEVKAPSKKRLRELFDQLAGETFHSAVDLPAFQKLFTVLLRNCDKEVQVVEAVSLDGALCEIRIQRSDRGVDLRQAISEEFAIRMQELRLVHGDRTLEDSEIIGSLSCVTALRVPLGVCQCGEDAVHEIDGKVFCDRHGTCYVGVCQLVFVNGTQCDNDAFYEICGKALCAEHCICEYCQVPGTCYMTQCSESSIGRDIVLCDDDNKCCRCGALATHAFELHGLRCDVCGEEEYGTLSDYASGRPDNYLTCNCSRSNLYRDARFDLG